MSGLANAWQYFAFLALASTKPGGLVALIIPYEWVSRPSAQALRDFVLKNNWAVSVYRLRDETFDHVLTTSSITVIDKARTDGSWKFFEEDGTKVFRSIASPTGANAKVIGYTRGSRDREVFARRGLSPGTQEILTLTEAERIAKGLHIRADVVRCITSLRPIPRNCRILTSAQFEKHVRYTGVKCWLVRTDREPSSRLLRYLKGIPVKKYRTATCASRDQWWRFTMPEPPAVLVATGFNGARPKSVQNRVRAVAVGSVSGVFGLTDSQARDFTRALHASRFRSRIVAHSNGLRKVEVGQLETFLARYIARS